jgi:hypothetical protein
MQSVGAHFGDRRLARGEVDLTDRRAQLVPSDRIYALLWGAQLELVQRDARGRRMYVEPSSGEEGLDAGVCGELTGCDGGRQKWLRESL